MDPFFELKTFTEVVEAGGISGAADRLNVAKSVVSRRLKSLESRLDVQLLVRTTRRQTLTEAGELFYARCINLLADLEEAEEAVVASEGPLRGRLRLAVPQTFGLMHVAPAVCEFIAHHPDLLIDLDFSDRRVDLVQEGFDMAIRIGVLADSTLRARRLSRIEMTVCASPGYLAHFGTPETPDDLTHHHCIRYSQAAGATTWRYRDRDREQSAGRVRVTTRVATNSGDFMREAAIAGFGLILSPTFVVGDALSTGTLVPVLTEYEWYESAPEQNVYAVFPPTQHLSRRVRVLTDFLSTRLNRHE